MRYTTLIDIREYPEVYRNHNVRLLYLHLVLACGYHDHDRDLVRCSLRNLANQTGLTVSAVRHALDVLRKWKLVRSRGSVHRIRKYVEDQTITPRAKSKKAAEELEARRMERAAQERREELEAADLERRHQQAQAGKTDFMVYYEQQVSKAAAGDEAAQRIVDSRRAQYEAHVNNLKNKSK